MNRHRRTVLTVDLGAESGRVMAVHFDGTSLEVEELHRFPNTPVTVNGTLYWDFLYLWREIQAGIMRGKALDVASLGVDTWGVDFGLLDAQGNLLGNPVHYRDGRTIGVMERTFEKVSRDAIFEQTGIQFMPYNTLYQLLSMLENGSPQLRIADTFLTAPDLLNYWLTGVRACEFSIATTTQMLDLLKGAWDVPMLEKLGLPTGILPDIVPPGTRLGEYEGVPVIAPACHDTGSAVAAVPAAGGDFAYISSGTWSLVGLEVSEPVINPAALAANVANEGGVFGTFRLLKNVMGLWILQQCRKTWSSAGCEYSYAELVDLAQEAAPFGALIDPDNRAFMAPGDHPAAISEFCDRSGQTAPSGIGETVRTVLESLALKYNVVLNDLKALTGRSVSALHLVGGGGRNRMLNQFTANATGLPVVVGPVEATVIGNAIVQLIALGEIENLEQGRAVVAGMSELEHYEPAETADWQAAYGRFSDLLTPGFDGQT